MDEELHDEALARGLIRYCPICDGYEVTDKTVGVIGERTATESPRPCSCAASPPTSP